MNILTPRKTGDERKPPWSGNLTMDEKLRAIILSKRWEAYQEDIRRARVYLLMELMYRGYQNIGPWDDLKGWARYDEEPMTYMENRFRRNCLINAGGLVRMEPPPIIRPRSGDFSDVEAAVTAQDAWDVAKDEFGYDQLIADKALQKVLFGNTFIYSGYRTGGTEIIMTPKFKFEDVTIDAAAICPQCAMTSPEGTPMCPQCGMPMQQFPSLQRQNQVVDGYESREKGELFSTAFSPLEIKIRSRALGGPKNWPYVLRIFREDTELLSYVYKEDFRGMPPSQAPTTSSPSSDLSVWYQQLLAAVPGNPWGNQTPYWNVANNYSDVDVVMGWLTPQTFRGDKDLEKEFPDGVMAVVVGDKVPEKRAEKITDVWTHEMYYPSPHSAYGDGMFDDAPIQKMINDVGQLRLQHFQYSTIPLRLYDSSMVLEQDFTNDPKTKWIKVATTLDRGLGDAVKDLPAQTLSQDVNVWDMQLRQVDQDISGVSDPRAGQIPGANTPYSAQILAVEQGQTLFVVSGKYNRVAQKDHVRQVLSLAKKHWVDPRRKAEIDQNTGTVAWKTFLGADLGRGSWDVYVMETDFKPKSRGEQMQALEQARLFGIDPAGSPKLRLQLFEKLGITPDGDTLSTQAKRAARVIERIKAGELVTPDPLIDDGMVQFAIIKDYMASEQGDQFKAENQQAWQALYLYMQTALQMAAMSNMAMAGMGLALPNPMGPPQGGPPQGGPTPQKTEHAQSPVPEGQQQPMPQVPARDEATGAPTP